MRAPGGLAFGGVVVVMLLATLAMPAPVARGAGPAIVSATLMPSAATVGDRLTLTIVVDHDAATTVDGPGFGADVVGLEIISVAPPRTEPRGAERRTTLAFTLTSFRTGDIAIPPQPASYRGPDGDGTLFTQPLAVSIRSVLAPGDTELAPLKPQLDLGESGPPAVVPVLFVAALAALTAFGYALQKRAVAVAPRASPVSPPAPRLAPDARAIADLDGIAAAGLAEGDDLGEYYARIAAVVRAYLSERFDVPAYAMTRTEIERAMTVTGIERWPARLAANLIEQCESVEFGGFRPAPNRRAADMASAYEIVAVTRTHELIRRQAL